MASDLAIALREVPIPDQLGDEVGEQRMVEAVTNPGEEGAHPEEDSFLAQTVELRIAVKKAGGYELVEDAHDDGGKDGEEDIVERQRPGLEDDFARI